jgi:hypothetical protein
MHYIFILKTAHNMRDRVSLADIRQKLITQTLTLGGTCDQSGNIHEFDDSRQAPFRLDDLRQGLHTRIGHFNYAGIGLDCAEKDNFLLQFPHASTH